LNEDFSRVLKQSMVVHGGSASEDTKLAKIQEDVNAVKGVMVQNLEKVFDRQDKIEVLVHEQYDSPDHLSPSTVPANPFDLFRQWFTSVQSTVHEPEIMALSTVSADGIPSTRTVLLKQVDDRGFVFYTNYNSRKSREMDVNPHVSLALYWREVHRQVRVVGRVEKVSREESDAYFRSRPLGSRIGAWASNQSTAIVDGEYSPPGSLGWLEGRPLRGRVLGWQTLSTA